MKKLAKEISIQLALNSYWIDLQFNMKKTDAIGEFLAEVVSKELKKAMINSNRWYKNCKSVRKRDGKICKECPFRKSIEELE